VIPGFLLVKYLDGTKQVNQLFSGENLAQMGIVGLYD
jgi:hypothetical protein